MTAHDLRIRSLDTQPFCYPLGGQSRKVPDGARKSVHVIQESMQTAVEWQHIVFLGISWMGVLDQKLWGYWS